MPNVSSLDESRKPDPYASHTTWPSSLRVVFRFTFPYLVLSTCFWLFEFADRSAALPRRLYLALWHPLVSWVALHLFHWPATVQPNFVHDTRYLYVLLSCFIIVSALVTLVWSVLDRRRTDYRAIERGLRVFLRYALAYLMLHYGMDKVFLLQFPAPALTRLIEPFGDYSPSSLMWAFIGSSIPFTIFGGLAEITGALFLLFRRTVTLGALITLAVMINVTVMDFSYDVSVKLFCVNLLLVAAYLAFPDSTRLLRFFVLNRPVEPVTLIPIFRTSKNQSIALACKAAVILFLIVPLIIRDWHNYKSQSSPGQRSALYGIYAVDQFTLKDDSSATHLTSPKPWQYIVFDKPNQLTIQLVDQSAVTYPATYDSTTHQLRMLQEISNPEAGLLTLSQQTPTSLQLSGQIGQNEISATLHKIDRSSFPLVSRGFHWMNESSYIH